MSAPRALDRALLDREFPLPAVPEDGDKEDRGRLLVVAGSREVPGAALLAGTAGLRAGAGKLQIATAAGISVALGIAVPEAMVLGIAETPRGCLAAAATAKIVALGKDARAMVVGCGLQHGPPLDRMLDGLLGSGLDTILVLDAAALGSLAPRAAKLRAWKGGAILLPHSREMARLLECAPEAVEKDPLAAARRAADLYGAVAVVKGPVSFVVAPDGRAFAYQGGGIGLATSGSGDVLAGITGGLAARGADPLMAALWGVWLHGEAGRQLSREVGRIGFLARELHNCVPRLIDGSA
jgi:ADP-dependent NAD(P)H-hydrate dehydratase